MKAIIILTIQCFSILHFSFGQSSTPLIGNSYITNVSHCVVYGIDGQDKIDETQSFFVNQDTKFTVIGFSAENDLIIVFWNYPGNGPGAHAVSAGGAAAQAYTRTYSANQSLIASWANDRDFIMKLKTFNSVCSIYYGKKFEFTWGVMTLPLKIRFGNGSSRDFTVEENLNLGFTVGLKQQVPGRHQQSFNYLAFGSMGRVTTDSSSLKTYIPPGSTTVQPYPAPSSNVASAFSTGLGCVFQYEGSFQVGFFLGVDFVTGQLGRYWKYQGKPWLGIALGVSLFTPSKTQTGTNGTNDTPAGH